MVGSGVEGTAHWPQPGIRREEGLGLHNPLGDPQSPHDLRPLTAPHSLQDPLPPHSQKLGTKPSMWAHRGHLSNQHMSLPLCVPTLSLESSNETTGSKGRGARMTRPAASVTALRTCEGGSAAPSCGQEPWECAQGRCPSCGPWVPLSPCTLLPQPVSARVHSGLAFPELTCWSFPFSSSCPLSK